MAKEKFDIGAMVKEKFDQLKVPILAVVNIRGKI